MPPLLEAYNYGGFWGFAAASAMLGTLGVFALGGATTTTNVYTYSGNTVVAGTALTANLGYGAAAGTSTLGVFAIDNTTATTTNVYTYAGNTVVAGTALTANLSAGAAAGTSTLGVFAVGNNTTTTNVYTYSGNTVVAGTALTATLNEGAAAGNYNGGLA